MKKLKEIFAKKAANKVVTDAKESITTHFEEHRETYRSAVILVPLTFTVARITRPYMRRVPVLLSKTGPKLLSGAGEPGRVMVDNTIRPFSFSFASRNAGNVSIVNNAVTTVHNGSRGNSGFITKHIPTGQLFATQKAAAEAFGIPESILSSHLNGKFKDALGETFERIGTL